MGLLAKLKSILGMGRSAGVEPDVTVERESEERERDRAGGLTGAEGSTAETDTRDRQSDGAEPGDETASESGAEATAGPETATDEGSAPVQNITGIGPAYAERLGEAGVETVSQLADAEAGALAAETDLSETRIEGWIEQARARTHKR
jgi:predicted flap endonuclease-1-like 5' DNA nuclease